MNCNAKPFVPSIEKIINVKYQESLDTIPFDVFMEYMIKKLNFKDICRLSMVSKSFNSYYSNPLIWKHFYIPESVRLFYPTKLNSIMKKCTGKHMKKEKVRIPLVIENNSDIPYDVYWIKQTPAFNSNYSMNNNFVQYNNTRCFNEYRKMKQINPGELHKIRTCENHHWMCIPTIEWLLENPYYNVGFGFYININFLEDYEHIKKIKPCDNRYSKNCNNFTSEYKLTYVKRIYQPKNLKLMPYINQKIKNFKYMFMKCVINETDFIKKINYKKTQMEHLIKDIKMYKKQIKTNKNEIKENNETSKSLEYALSVCGYKFTK